MGFCIIVLNLKYNREKTTKSDKKAPFGCRRPFLGGSGRFSSMGGWRKDDLGAMFQMAVGGLRRLGAGLSLPPHRRRQADAPSRRGSAMEGGMRKTGRCSKNWRGRPVVVAPERFSGRLRNLSFLRALAAALAIMTPGSAAAAEMAQIRPGRCAGADGENPRCR